MGADVEALVVVAGDFWAVAWALGAVRLGGTMNRVAASAAGVLCHAPTRVATAAGAMDFGLALAVALGGLAATRAGA